jgi:putative salt-induced outer membrane protein YdiY
MTVRHVRNLVSAAVVPLLLMLSNLSRAQDVQKGTGTGIDQATKGSTDITTDKFVTTDKDAAKDAKDATEFSVSAGTMNAGGNARLVATTGNSKFRLRRAENQFKSALAANYARSAPPDGPMDTTVQNFQGLLRYDRFLGDFSLFLSAQGRNDKFLGIDARVQIDPGVAYYFLNRKTYQLWGEFGYDLLFDIRNEDARVQLDKDKKPLVDADGRRLPLLDKTRTLHSARVFAGYEHSLSATTKLTAGLEYLQGIAGSETSSKYARRLNGDVALTSKIWEALGISFSFSERYDNKPLPGKKNLDTIVAASLVYTVM